MIYYFTPYSTEKKLGEVYNQYCKLVPNDDDWICLMDGDVMFMTPDWGHQIEAIIKSNPQYSLFTCVTNRIKNEQQQIAKGFISDQSDLLKLHQLAKLQKEYKMNSITPLDRFISGFFMLFKKKLWKQIPFPVESKRGTILAIDNKWSSQVLKAGHKIGRMDGLMVVHYYRLHDPSISDKHLR